MNKCDDGRATILPSTLNETEKLTKEITIMFEGTNMRMQAGISRTGHLNNDHCHFQIKVVGRPDLCKCTSSGKKWKGTARLGTVITHWAKWQNGRNGRTEPPSKKACLGWCVCAISSASWGAAN